MLSDFFRFPQDLQWHSKKLHFDKTVPHGRCVQKWFSPIKMDFFIFKTYGAPSVQKLFLLFYAQKTRSCNIFVVKNSCMYKFYHPPCAKYIHPCANSATHVPITSAHVQNVLHMHEQNFVHSLLFALKRAINSIDSNTKYSYSY